MKIRLKLFGTFAMLLVVLAFASPAQADETRRIRFAKGKSSATVEYAVLREEVVYYLVRAGEGQRMTIGITATENNASFRIYSPSGEYLEGAGETDDPTEWSGDLPESGDYRIEVAPTRGNADYRLTVSIN